MALTKEQWLERLKTWVPTWVFEEEQYNVAIYQAIARLLADRAFEVESIVSQTYIDTATSSFLDLHGSERSVPRLAGELDGSYRVRIKNKSLKSQCDRVSISNIVNSLLIRGVCAIKEDWEGGVFTGFSYANRGEIILEPIENTFTIVVDRQVHDPYSFLGRENFAGREDFVGQNESNAQVFELILQSVNDAKAFGTLYRIIERLN